MSILKINAAMLINEIKKKVIQQTKQKYPVKTNYVSYKSSSKKLRFWGFVVL